MVKKYVSLALLVAIAFGAGFFAGHGNDRHVAAQNEGENDADFDLLMEAYDVLNDRYVDPLDQEQLIDGAIEGMVESIGDPNMDYLSAEELAEWQQSLSGNFEGIGATVDKDDATGGLRIVAPIPGSPAEEAGLLPGDIIMTVDGEDITTLEQNDIISKVRGPAGTDVTLGILREGEEDLIEFTITRDVIQSPTLDYRMLDNNIGYIRLYQFNDQASLMMYDALTELDANNLDGLILDLRANPGGYLQTTLEILSMFVDEGPILIEQMPGEEEVIEEAFGGAIAPDVPIAVLVNEGSASASEIVAGSLRDRERAVVIGTPTFGKNTVQTIVTLSDGSAVRVSIARWVTPNGFSPQPDGLKPDVLIEYDPESDPEFDNQMAAAVRALKSMKREQAGVPALSR